MEFLNLPNELIWIIDKKLTDSDQAFLGLTCRRLLSVKKINKYLAFTSSYSRLIHGFEWNYIDMCPDVSYFLTINNNVPGLQYVHNEISNTMSYKCLVTAIKLANIESIRFLYFLLKKRDYSDLDEHILKPLFKCGNIEVLEFFEQMGFFNQEFPYRYIVWAYSSGNIETVKFIEDRVIIDERLDFSGFNISSAGHVTVAASITGNVDLLRHAIEKGYQIEDHTFIAAIERGHFECTKYLLDNHEFSITSHWHMKNAILSGKKNIFDLLLPHVDHIDNWELMAKCCEYDNLDVLKYFLDRGQLLDKRQVQIVINTHSDKIGSFLRKNWKYMMDNARFLIFDLPCYTKYLGDPLDFSYKDL
jgi:hypothetical protein